jgi:L-ribulose-5-phosphate 3-epimerase
VNLPIGAMQGRLVPKEDGRFQSFPASRWRDEFPRAKEAGLACIEWIYEEPNESKNPLGTDDGIQEIQRLAQSTGVGVRSICADFYMTKRLITPQGQIEDGAVSHLAWLIGRAQRLDITYIVLPFVDSSSLRSEIERSALPNALSTPLKQAKAANIELHLETDLAPPDFAALLESIGHANLKANYDIGNSASLGYEPEEELSLLGPWLGSVHVKDRVRNGTTVPLGTGNADLPLCFRKFRQIGFHRWYILQAARGREGDEVAWTAQNRLLVEQLSRAN